MSAHPSLDGPRHGNFYDHPVRTLRYGAGAARRRPWQRRLLAGVALMLCVVLLMSASAKWPVTHDAHPLVLQQDQVQLKQLQQQQDQQALLQQLQQQLQEVLQQLQAQRVVQQHAAASSAYMQPDYRCSAYASTPFPVNMWYVKAPKAGSTTLTSIFNHICSRYGIVWLKDDEMVAIQEKSWGGPTTRNSTALVLLHELSSKVRAQIENYYLAVTSHMPYSEAAAAATFNDPVWLFSSVRHPVPRLYSHYVQDLLISTAKGLGWNSAAHNMALHPDNFDFNATLWAYALRNDTVERRWRHAKAEVGKNFLYGYLKGSGSTPQAVLDKYKFVFVVERMDESLVLFMLEFGLTYADIAYLPLKQRVGKYKTAKDMPAELNNFILKNNDKDLKLWELANARLNVTRQQIEQRCGASAVAAALKTFQQLQAAIGDQCISKADEWYQANSNYLSWVKHTAMRSANVASQSGEGYRCVRHVVRTFMEAKA